MVSIGNDPGLTRRSATARSSPRRGVPSWAARRPAPDAHAAQAVAVGLRFLEPHGWVSLDDVRRPGWPSAGIDHVVVGPGGVVVVQVVPRADGGPDGTAAADAVAAADAAQAAGAVTALLAPRHRSAVRAVVCAPGRTRPTVTVGGVTVLGCEALVTHLRALPPRLGPADAAGLAQYLDVRLDGPEPADLLTTATPTDVPAHRRAVRPRTRPSAPAAAGRAHAAPGRLGRVFGAGVVSAFAWLAWVFTTSPLGLF